MPLAIFFSKITINYFSHGLYDNLDGLQPTPLHRYFDLEESLFILRSTTSRCPTVVLGILGGRLDAGQWRTIDLDLSRYDSIAARFALEQREDLSILKSGIDTRSLAFNALIGRIERVAVASPLPILLTGPTGAGKSHLARRIYDLNRRREQVRGNLVEVNCATLRGDQAMSALFGHARGAFTGAAAARAGLLRAADGGILFLDEIGELGLDEQAMLLRAIEERRFLPVGSDTEVASDFQLLAGTTADLSAAVGAGRFRADLLARIGLA